MATTNFVDGQTVIEASWLNDVDEAVYNPASIDIPAASVINTPYGNIAAVDVQNALNELDDEKQPIDATLTALAGLATGADKIPYSTGTDTFGQLSWNTGTALAASATTISSNTVIKTAIDELVANSTTAASDGAADYILFEDATDGVQKKVLIDNAVADSMNASGTAPMYACRAWVNFNGTAAGTWAGGASTVTRVSPSTTATVTCTNDHGLSTDHYVYALTGVVAGLYKITVSTSKIFTFTTAADTDLTAVAITFGVVSILGSGNVVNVTDNGTGDYTINFSTGLPSANYAVSGMTASSTTTNASSTILLHATSTVPTTKTTLAVRVASLNSAAAGAVDSANISLTFFG